MEIGEVTRGNNAFSVLRPSFRSQSPNPYSSPCSVFGTNYFVLHSLRRILRPLSVSDKLAVSFVKLTYLYTKVVHGGQDVGWQPKVRPVARRIGSKVISGAERSFPLCSAAHTGCSFTDTKTPADAAGESTSCTKDLEASKAAAARAEHTRAIRGHSFDLFRSGCVLHTAMRPFVSTPHSSRAARS